MTQPNEDLVRAASAAFGRGDLNALRDRFFADNIIWHVAGTGPLAGGYQGAAQVIGQLGKIAGLPGGTVRPELHDVLVSTDHTVVLATIRAARAGKHLQLNVARVIHAENDKSTEASTHSSDPAAAAAFWSWRPITVRGPRPCPGTGGMQPPPSVLQSQAGFSKPTITRAAASTTTRPCAIAADLRVEPGLGGRCQCRAG